MKVDIERIFCEFVTGMIFMALCLTLFLFSDNVKLPEILSFLKEYSNIPNLLIFLMAAGLIGFVIDGIGLGFGEIFFDKIIYGYDVSPEKRIKFFEEVSEPVLAYRNRQWAYYSCYRNLFLLLIFYIVAILFTISDCRAKIILIIAVLFINFFLYQCLKLLLKLYYSFENKGSAK
jgi:hypothetical protein